MKTRSILRSCIFGAMSLLFFTNCSNTKKEDSNPESHEGHDHEMHASGNNAKEAAEPLFQVDQKFQEQLSRVFNSYIDVKDAFVQSDPEKVKSKASETRAALTQVDMKLLSGAPHNDWMNYMASIESALQEITSAQDLETQRKSFRTLSESLYKSIKAFGLGGEEAYYEFCPMAFNNEGAYWLSESETIKNPYFGDKMLTCGSVEEKLK